MPKSEQNAPAKEEKEEKSVKTPNDRPNVSSSAFFFGCAIILVLVAIILTVGGSLKHPTLSFGSCTLKADIAASPSQKAKGLSGRVEVAENYAMIFPFQDEQPMFWMKDMLTPIDILWVNDNTVVQIDANALPDDGAAKYSPAQPIDWVVETQAGRAAACGVTNGSTIKGLRS